MAKSSKQATGKRSFKDWLLRRCFVRWHISAILAATIASGVLLGRTLKYFDLGNMAWRYALSVLGVYGFFFLLVRMWVWYAAGIGFQSYLPVRLRDTGLDAAVELIPCGPPGNVQFSGFRGDAGDGTSFDLDIDLDDGMWIVSILAIDAGPSGF